MWRGFTTLQVGREREGDSEREGRKRNGKEMEVEKRSR